MSEAPLPAAALNVAPPVPSQEQLDALAAGIRAVSEQAALEVAVSVGRLIVEGFYGGDLVALRSRDPGKDTSLRRLAEHRDVPYGASSLSRFVGVFELTERLGGVATWQHLTASHWRALLGLPDTTQKKLAREAQEGRWPVARLEAEVAALRSTRIPRGRPPLHPLVKGVRAIHRTLITRSEFLEGDVSALDPGAAAELLDDLSTITERLEGLKAHLRPLAEESNTIDVRAEPASSKRSYLRPKNALPIAERVKAAQAAGASLQDLAAKESMTVPTLTRWLFLADLPAADKARIAAGEIKTHREAKALADASTGAAKE